MKEPKPDQEPPNDRLAAAVTEDQDRQETDRRCRDAVTRYFSILQEWSMKDRQDDPQAVPRPTRGLTANPVRGTCIAAMRAT